MPKQSRRQQVIKKLTAIYRGRLLGRFIRHLDDDVDHDLEDAFDVAVAKRLYEVCGSRYLFRRKYRNSRKEAMRKIERDLKEDHIGDEEEERAWLTDVEFKQKYRVDRESFNEILSRIKDHHVFAKKHRGRPQCSVDIQLCIFLKWVGTEGDGANNSGQRNTFDVSYGFAQLARRRVAVALCSLSQEFISWPTAEEKAEIAGAFYEMSDMKHCIGVIDGTLFPLFQEPQTQDSPDYHGRKFQWSLSVLIVNDHKRRIRYYLAGFPGSCHDNRIWKASDLFKNSQEYFSTLEYLLGDSAYSNSRVMVSAFKKPVGHPMPQLQEKFNTQLAKARILSEHTIGMLKCRFPWLRSIRLTITTDKKTTQEILMHIHATVVLHNWLIKLNDDTDGMEEEEDDSCPCTCGSTEKRTR